MTGLRRSATTQALIDLEDAAPTILDERLPGAIVPFWIQVRMQFTTLLSEDELGDATIPTTVSLSQVLRRLAFSYLPSRNDAVRSRDQREIVHIVGGTTLHQREGRARNWLVGAYAEALPQRSLIVQRTSLKSALGPPAFQPTYSLDPMFARAELRVALRRGIPSPNDARVRELVVELARLLGVNEDPRLAAIIDSAVWAERNRPSVAREFSLFLDRVRPKVLLLEDASYGDLYATLVALACARGVAVAEPQHGWIGPAHAAYNYGAAMHRPHNAVALPGTLLTFGEHWSSGLSYPGAIAAIGKAHLEERLLGAPDPALRPREVLVVSSVAAADVTLRFLGELRRALPPEWALRFRPHPSERAVLSTRYAGIHDLGGVTVDNRADVFDSLAACRIVIGVASTVLFEAAAFGCRVFVRDSPYVPVVVGDLFGAPLSGSADISRVVRVATHPDASDDGRPSVDITRLWRPDAVGNYTRWAESVGPPDAALLA